MPAQKLIKINLLPKDSFEESGLGRFLGWALSSGRAIVILTEFVVVVAFGSRFWFDQKLNDLMEEVEAKEAVVESYSEVEGQMRDILAREEKIAKFLKGNLKLIPLFNSFKQATPGDVFLQSFAIDKNQIKIKGKAGSEKGFASFLNNLSYVPGVSSIRLGKTVFEAKSNGVVFEVLAVLSNKK